MPPSLSPELIFHETVKFVSCYCEPQLAEQRVVFQLLNFTPSHVPLSPAHPQVSPSSTV